jgi:hypothetical protein
MSNQYGTYLPAKKVVFNTQKDADGIAPLLVDEEKQKA